MTGTADFLSIAGARKSFFGTRVLDNVNLGVKRGEFVSLLGPSGCGKTTLLRIVAGLLQPDAGAVRLDGEDIIGKPPHRRDVGVVFQNYALFPHLTVAENVAFGLEARRASREHTWATVARFLELVHMGEFADRSIRVLSGGQQQRVAVARALAVRPKLLLLDEPFSALDRKLRETMQIELKRLLRELSTTAVFVTHDQDEALMMSDRIAVMNRGAIEQLADPANNLSSAGDRLRPRICRPFDPTIRIGRRHGASRPRDRAWTHPGDRNSPARQKSIHRRTPRANDSMLFRRQGEPHRTAAARHRVPRIQGAVSLRCGQR
jgi:ABC-type Fe3+/spermidine/putrescine transport system ATPase subunit